MAITYSIQKGLPFLHACAIAPNQKASKIARIRANFLTDYDEYYSNKDPSAIYSNQIANRQISLG